MPAPDRPLYRAIFIFVLAPIAAAVIIAVLLLFGVEPHRVFAFGFAVKSLLNRMGVMRVPNAVGVLSTVALWWAAIVALGFAWERRRKRRSA